MEDIYVVNQRKHDLELVRLADSVKIGDGEGASGEDRRNKMMLMTWETTRLTTS